MHSTQQPLTSRNFLEQAHPGGVGIRRDGAGFWLPVGVRMEFLSPMAQARVDWERDRRAGGMASPAGPLVRIATCARCTICIGRGYTQTEVYLWPSGFERVSRSERRRIAWRFCCAWCANDLGMRHGYCLVAHLDWTDTWRAELDRIRVIPAAVIDIKARVIERTLVPAWNAYSREQKARYRAEHGTLDDFPLDKLFKGFYPTAPVPVLTYTTIRSYLDRAIEDEGAA